MALYLNNPTINTLERRLRDPEGTAPTPAEIVAAVSGVGGGEAIARARAWAVQALYRANASPETIIAMMDAAEAAARGQAVAFSGPIASRPVPAPDEVTPETPPIAVLLWNGTIVLWDGVIVTAAWA